MMMKNRKLSASKLRNGRRQKEQQQRSSPRSPLMVKDLNVSASCSSSSTATTATSISSEAPMGCLRFFLSSHHDSSAAKKACNKPKSAVAKTPRSAFNIKNLRGKSSDENDVMKNCNDKQNSEKPISRGVHRLRKNPTLNSITTFPEKSSSGSEIWLCDNAAKFSPVTKMGSGSGVDSFNRNDKAFESGDKGTNYSDTSSPVPPVQASVSPEIHGGSMLMMPATPSTCYGAGHVLSGVSDRRKCKPRGILTIGEDLFGSISARNKFDTKDENVIMAVNNHRASLVPSPTEASVRWIKSPCYEERSEGQEDDGGNGLRLNLHERLIPFKSSGCLSSPSSSFGCSSELFNKSNSIITNSDATTTTPSSRKGKGLFLHPDSTSEFQSVLGPSFDHLVCNLTPSPPVLMPSRKFGVSPEQGKSRYDHAGEATPYLEDLVGSGNVIQTPQSNSSSPNFDLSHLSRDEISRLWFECELDSVTEVLRRVSLSPECQMPTVDSSRTSFEFNPLIKPASPIDFTHLRTAIDNQIPAEVPELLLHNVPDSEVRISWREGLAGRILETDDVDCCRCFSDEEDDANDYSGPCEFSSCLDLVTADPNKIVANTCARVDGNGERSFPSGGLDPCKETTSNDGGILCALKDSGWTQCYKNNLFQV